MELTERQLQEVGEMCVDFYAGEKEHIISVILYGGAAKNFVGIDHTPGDFDLNMFFSEQSTISSTVGMPKVIGDYSALEVEVMRNRVPEELTVEEYVNAQNSKRWERIRNEPVVQVYLTFNR